MLSLIITHVSVMYHSLLLIITNYHSLSLIIIHYHSLSLIVTHYHSLSLTYYHSCRATSNEPSPRTSRRLSAPLHSHSYTDVPVDSDARSWTAGRRGCGSCFRSGSAVAYRPAPRPGSDEDPAGNSKRFY